MGFAKYESDKKKATKPTVNNTKKSDLDTADLQDLKAKNKSIATAIKNNEPKGTPKSIKNSNTRLWG